MSASAIPQVPRATGSLSRRWSRAGFLFVLPAVAFTTIFFILPLFMTGYMSLYNWPLLGQRSFIGLDNYATLLSDKQFGAALLFTFKYAVLVTPAIFLLAFALAMLVNTALAGVGFFRTAYFLPVVIGLGTSSLLWVWLLDGRVGIFNGILMQLGVIDKSIIWLATKNLALYSIIVSVVWKTVGFSMILLLTGMQAIPLELYDAAKVDGAGFWTQLWYVTLPMLRRSLALALVLSVIGSLLAFDQFYIMTRGGPQNQTITAVYWIVINSFTYFKMGYGAALSLVMLVLLVVVSLVQLRLLRDDSVE